MAHRVKFRVKGKWSASLPRASTKADMPSPEGRPPASALRTTHSDFDLFRYCESIVNFDPKISHRALNLRMAKQKLNRPQISGATVNEGNLGPA